MSLGEKEEGSCANCYHAKDVQLLSNSLQPLQRFIKHRFFIANQIQKKEEEEYKKKKEEEYKKNKEEGYKKKKEEVSTICPRPTCPLFQPRLHRHIIKITTDISQGREEESASAFLMSVETGNLSHQYLDRRGNLRHQRLVLTSLSGRKRRSARMLRRKRRSVLRVIRTSFTYLRTSYAL